MSAVVRRMLTIAVSLLLSLALDGAARADFVMKYNGLPMDQKLCIQNGEKICARGNMQAELVFSGDLPANYTGELNRNGFYFKSGTIGVSDVYKVNIPVKGGFFDFHFVNGRVTEWYVGVPQTKRPACPQILYHFQTSNSQDYLDSDQQACPPRYYFYGVVRRPPSNWVVAR